MRWHKSKCIELIIDIQVNPYSDYRYISSMHIASATDTVELERGNGQTHDDKCLDRGGRVLCARVKGKKL